MEEGPENGPFGRIRPVVTGVIFLESNSDVFREGSVSQKSESPNGSCPLWKGHSLYGTLSNHVAELFNHRMVLSQTTEKGEGLVLIEGLLCDLFISR